VATPVPSIYGGCRTDVVWTKGLIMPHVLRFAFSLRSSSSEITQLSHF
jgi:hypothetical protein